MYLWGGINTLEEYEESLYETTGSREIPTTPGAVAFPDIYHKSVVVIDPRCPARYVNDARGTKLQNNIVFELVPDVRKTCLDHNKGAHLILQAQALKDIEKNEQLLADYGDDWWGVKDPKKNKTRFRQRHHE